MSAPAVHLEFHLEPTLGSLRVRAIEATSGCDPAIFLARRQGVVTSFVRVCRPADLAQPVGAAADTGYFRTTEVALTGLKNVPAAAGEIKASVLRLLRTLGVKEQTAGKWREWLRAEDAPK